MTADLSLLFISYSIYSAYDRSEASPTDLELTKSQLNNTENGNKYQDVVQGGGANAKYTCTKIKGGSGQVHLQTT